jgi:hypothetical protein
MERAECLPTEITWKKEVSTSFRKMWILVRDQEAGNVPPDKSEHRSSSYWDQLVRQHKGRVLPDKLKRPALYGNKRARDL